MYFLNVSVPNVLHDEVEMAPKEKKKWKEVSTLNQIYAEQFCAAEH